MANAFGRTIAQRTPSFHSLFRIEGHRRKRRGGRCDVDIGAAGALGTKLHTSLLQVWETSLGDIGLEGHEDSHFGPQSPKFPRNAARNSTLYSMMRQK